MKALSTLARPPLPTAGESAPPPGRDDSIHALGRSENPAGPAEVWLYFGDVFWASARAIERRAGLRYVPEDASDVPSMAMTAKICWYAGHFGDIFWASADAIERRAGIRYVPEDASDVPSTATPAKKCRRSGHEVGADVFRVGDGRAGARHAPEGCRGRGRRGKGCPTARESPKVQSFLQFKAAESGRRPCRFGSPGGRRSDRRGGAAE